MTQPFHIGFSSKTRCNKLQRQGFSILDADCIIDDTINQFNIPFGQVPGDPSIGTSLWDYIFEPNSEETRLKIETEVRRILNNDTRIQTGSIRLLSSEHTVYVFIEAAIRPTNKIINFSVAFNSLSNRATLNQVETN